MQNVGGARKAMAAQVIALILVFLGAGLMLVFHHFGIDMRRGEDAFVAGLAILTAHKGSKRAGKSQPAGPSE